MADRDSPSGTNASSDEWYFDLHKGVAVPASERGHADHMLGPYRTKGEAENWKSTVESRNEAWDEDDAEWSSWGENSSSASASMSAATSTCSWTGIGRYAFADQSK